ncbi:MAG: helix-turn-helix domain-containing protein [Phaeodactylibacter sp.]|nr:helix-turn-helix domain-containing protein [Phaeodactylibacter sp.]
MEKIPDIIISDVMMPGKDGFELCATLKADHRTSHIPIILLTAKAGQQHKIEGLEQGADAYLTKPFDVRELKVRMAKLIEQRQRLKEQFAGELRLKPTEVSLASMDQRFLQSVIKQIEENIGNEYYSVEELAHSVGFSRSQLHRKLKALADKSPNQLIRDFRLARAKELLEQKSATVSEVAYQVGYSNLSYFSKSYKDAFGVSPSASGTN